MKQGLLSAMVEFLGSYEYAEEFLDGRSLSLSNVREVVRQCAHCLHNGEPLSRRDMYALTVGGRKIDEAMSFIGFSHKEEIDENFLIIYRDVDGREVCIDPSEFIDI